MKLADAQKAARDDPKLRAAVATSGKKAVVGAGITDDPDVDVELFALVKDAEAVFKGRKDMLEKDGFVTTFGTIARGLVILERDDPPAACSMSLTKRPAKNPSKGGSTE